MEPGIGSSVSFKLLSWLSKGVIFWVPQRVSRWLLLDAYEISTYFHWHREFIEVPSRPLGEHLGYRIFKNEYLNRTRQYSPTIEICILPKRFFCKGNSTCVCV